MTIPAPEVAAASHEHPDSALPQAGPTVALNLHLIAAMSKSVLVVEDDPDISLLIATALRTHCETIDRAADGALAVDMLRARTYDLLILDIMLPKMNGLAVADVALGLPSPPAILVVSAIARYIDGDGRFPKGAMTLQKPFDLQELEQAVTSLLHRPT